jgi:hypothetical protein
LLQGAVMIEKYKIRLVLFVFAFLLGAGGAFAQTVAPSIFFTDIASGPASGGESVSGFAGAYVTIYGNNFGTTQGGSTVTLGGQSCLRVVSWGATYLWYQKIVVQLGSTCSSGAFSVTVSSTPSVCSDSVSSCQFTVRNGAIHCVSTSGNDSSSGSFPSSCWATIPKAASSMAAGDITYVENGVTAGSDNGYGSPLVISGMNGTASSPFQLVVYPGATATIGGNANSRGIIEYPNPSSYWTIAGFVLQNTGVASGSNSEALHLYAGSSNWRIVGNSFTCPEGDGFTACMTTDGSNNDQFWGNRIHDTGASGSDKEYHAFYFGDLTGGTNNHGQDVGWNQISNIQGCRGIQFHSKDSIAGSEAYGLSIHDNLIFNVRCDGIALANTNPDKGAVNIFNNVIYNTGTGPDPADGAANYSCIYVGDTNGNPTTAVQEYNNTCYNGGSRGASEGDAGAFTCFIKCRLTNNVVDELSGEAYLSGSTTSQCSSCVMGSNNDWFGLGTAPSQTTANLSVNPLFVSTSSSDFRLNSGSPVIGVGITTAMSTFDHNGLVRPHPPSLGAYEFAAGTLISQKPSAPTNLVITVQ